MKNILINTVLLTAGLYVSSAQASVEMLEKFFKDITTLEARFDQAVIDETGLTLEQSSGTFYLSRPGKFRWDYQSEDLELDSGQQIVADGESIFMYDPDLEQVTKRGLEDALGQVPSLLLVQTGADIEKHFVVNDFGLIDGLTWAGLKPLDENAGYQQLMIGFLGEEINTITLVDGLGNETRLSLTAVKGNPELSQDIFDFAVPEGADVFGQ